jgi:hypothetical protein
MVACGHKGDAKSDAAPTPDVATAELAAPQPTATDLNGNGKPDKDPTDQDWPGKMAVVLGDADSPEATQGRTFMENTHLLNHLADDINKTLKLPFDVTLKGEQCGSPNDFWSPGDKTLTMCYEDATASIHTFEKLGYPDPEGAAFNTEAGFFYHEVGHMVIDIYDLPATGREEDIADEASAYLMLLQNDDGKVDPASIDSSRTSPGSMRTPQTAVARWTTVLWQTCIPRTRPACTTSSVGPTERTRRGGPNWSVRACCRRDGLTAARTNTASWSTLGARYSLPI